MSVVLENAPNFSALVEYRMVDGGAAAEQLNASFGDLLRAVGFSGTDVTEREEMQALEKLIEDIAIYTSKGSALYPRPADQEDRAAAVPEENAPPAEEDANNIHLKFSNGLRGRDANGIPIKFFRDDVTAVVQQARLCGVRDYRMSDEMVVQLPGLPITEAELVRLGQANVEVYEVIIPLDRDGLLVHVTPKRSNIRVVEGNNYPEQEEIDRDHKILLFLQYGTALVLPATTHYSTHHRTSMTGGLHIKTLVTVSKKEFGDDGKEVKPQIAGVPLGNVAVGYAGPVGIRIPKNERDNIAAIKAKDLAYTGYEEMNGQFGKHLIVGDGDKYVFPRLFSQYCLPAKFDNKKDTKNDSNKRQKGKGSKKKTPTKKRRGSPTGNHGTAGVGDA
jgi:hypothetical protein